MKDKTMSSHNKELAIKIVLGLLVAAFTLPLLAKIVLG
jgi:hypothetical protein